jgi:hypothetical protein
MARAQNVLKEADMTPLIALLISSYVNHTTHLIIAKSSELKVFSKSAT